MLDQGLGRSRLIELSRIPSRKRSRQVIDAEGPLPELVLFRRVARAWGLERTGSRIVQRLRSLVPAYMSQTIEGETVFYWPADSIPNSWEAFRISNHDERSQRNVSEVCSQEIGNLVLHVLHHGGAAPRQDIARSVCRLLGMARTPADAESRVNVAVDKLIAGNKLADFGGHIREVG